MIYLVSTSDKITVETTTSATIAVHASFVDIAGTVLTIGRNNLNINSVTTSDVVSSPTINVQRTVKFLTFVNTSSTTDNTVIIRHTDGTTSAVLMIAYLSPGAKLTYTEAGGFLIESTLDFGVDPWAGDIIACARDGNPNYVLSQMQLAGNVAATPTNISTTVARCELFRPRYQIEVNKARWYGIGATTGLYTMAIYRYSDLARISEQLTLTTTSAAWNSADFSTPFTLQANERYFIAVGVTATGTTPGIGCLGGTVAATTGQIAVAPTALPGNLGSGVTSTYRFQFAVTAGALPATANTLVGQANWTGGMPAFWLDNSNA